MNVDSEDNNVAELDEILSIASNNAKPPRKENQNRYSRRRMKYRKNKRKRLKSSIIRIDNNQNKNDSKKEENEIDLPDKQDINPKELQNLKSFLRTKSDASQQLDNKEINITNSTQISTQNNNRIISLSHITGHKREILVSDSVLPTKKRKLSPIKDNQAHKNRVISLRHITT